MNFDSYPARMKQRVRCTLSEQAGAKPTYWTAVENLNADWTVAGA